MNILDEHLRRTSQILYEHLRWTSQINILDEHLNAHRSVHLVNLNVLEELELEFELFNYYSVGLVVGTKLKLKFQLKLELSLAKKQTERISTCRSRAFYVSAGQKLTHQKLAEGCHAMPMQGFGLTLMRSFINRPSGG